MEKDAHNASKATELFIAITAIAFSLFQMYTAFSGPFAEAVQRSIHLCFALILVFLIYDLRGNKRKVVSVSDLLIIVVSVISTIYIVFYFNDLVFRQARINNLDTVVGWIVTLVVIEGTRRVIGLPLVILAIGSILYALLGGFLPGIFLHSGFSLKMLADRLVMDVAGAAGIYGMTLGVSTTYVFVFILFGAFFESTGGTAFIMDFSKALIGRFTGGSAKLSVISSGLFGSISGSASANVTVTGAMTIPMMIRSGFPRNFAAAVEATASSGGLIMPPIMGAVGFIIAEVLGIAYVEVIKAAFLPATIYFISLFFGADLVARKLNLSKIPAEEIPSLLAVVRQRWVSVIPILVLLYLLVIERLSPGLAATWSIVVMIALNFLSKLHLGMSGVKIVIAETLKSLQTGAETSLIVVTTLAIVGIPMCIISTTGVGLQFGSFMLQTGGDSLFMLLFLAMIACIVLGTGLEAAAAYIMISIILVPALIKFGVPLLAGHLFIYYFGVLSNVTPPVAITSYVAAGLANSNAFKTALLGFRLSLAGFLIPYMLIYRSELMMVGSFLNILYVCFVLLIGCFALQASMIGYLFADLGIPARILLLAASIMLIIPHTFFDIIGLIIIFLLISFLLYRHKRSLTVVPVSSLNSKKA